MGRAPVVAVFNTSSDIVDLLRFTFEHAGFVVISAMTSQVREGTISLDHFVMQHDPDVVVYDIAPPYEENWRLLEHMWNTPALRDRPIVLTTTNAVHVRNLAGDRQLFEIIGKPYDLDQIVSAARKALPPEMRPGLPH
jgi:CheY-like chemotaxis protein